MTGWQGVVDFRGPGIGSVGVRVSTRYAEILATAMAGEDVRAVPAMQADAVGETANILSSSVMALLYGPRRQVTISSPKVTGDIADMPSVAVEGLVQVGLLVDHEHLVQVWLLVDTENAKEGTL
jgi:CheY-specific phosphatase CheX